MKLGEQDEKRLLKHLKRGSQNVTSSYALADTLAIPQKSIGFVVNRLRRQGHPVGSIHGEGYYLIKTEAELEATVAHIAKRKIGIDQTIKALRHGFRNGQ